MATVREYRAADEERALQIFKAGLMQYAVEGSVVRHMENGFFASKTAPDGDMFSIEQFYSQHPDRAFFVAELGLGQVCGICGAVLNEGGQSVELQRMSVSAESRGQGAGGLLVQAVVAFAKARQGVNKVSLGTLDSKVDAIRLYERHGFKQVEAFQLPATMFKEEFGVDTDEVVKVLKFELELEAAAAAVDGWAAAAAAAAAAAI